MISQIRNGGLLAVALAASAVAGPVAVKDVEVVPAVQERGLGLGLELGTYSLQTSHVNDVLVDLRAGAQVGPVSVAADVGLFIQCVDCRSWGNAVVTHSGVTKDEGLLGDLVEFLENPVDAIVSAFDMDIRVDFENVGGHFEFDIEAEAGTSISLSIFESELVTGIAASLDVSVGLLLAVDLVFALDAEIDVTAGFEFSLPEGSFITVDPLTGDIVDKSFAGGNMNQLPITIIAGEATIEACLRVRLQVGTTVEVFGTGFDFELGAYVDVFDYTAVAIGESHNCGLFISEKVDLAVGVYALFVLDIDYKSFLAVPAVITVLLELDLPNVCLLTPPNHGHGHGSSSVPTLPSGTGSAGGYPTSPSGEGYPTGYPTIPGGNGYPTSTPSGQGYPTLPSLGYPTLPSGTGYPTGYPTTSGAPYPTGTASASGSPIPSSSANATITSSAPVGSATGYSTSSYTITSCAATGIYCPVSSSSQIVVTTVCSGTPTQTSAAQTTTYPANTPSGTPAGTATSTPYATSAPQSLTPVATPTPSTVYTPTTCTPTNTIVSASTYPVLNPSYTSTPAPAYTTYPAGQYPSSPASPSGAASPSGVVAPTGYSVQPTGAAPTSSPAPFTGAAARSSGSVMAALAVALFGAVALM